MQMQGALAIAVILAFVATIAGWMLKPPTADPNALAVLNTLTGVLGSAFMAIVQYYFGSSSGSKTKDDTINKALGVPPPVEEKPAIPLGPRAV